LKNTFLDYKIFVSPEAADFAESCSGNNAKHVLLVLHTQEQNERLQELLKKIMAAVQVDLINDALLLSVEPNHPYSFAQLARNHTIEKVLLFGTPLQQLGLHFELPPYWLTEVQGRQFLFVDDLDTISQDKKRKAALWKCLQELFEV